MKSLLILVVIGVFGLRIFAEDSNISLRIANDHNRNISRDLKLKIIKLMNAEIAKNTTYAQTQTMFAKSKEEALIEVGSIVKNCPQKDFFFTFYHFLVQFH